MNRAQGSNIFSDVRRIFSPSQITSPGQIRIGMVLAEVIIFGVELPSFRVGGLPFQDNHGTWVVDEQGSLHSLADMGVVPYTNKHLRGLWNKHNWCYEIPPQHSRSVS